MKEKIKKAIIESSIYFILAIILMISGVIILDILSPSPAPINLTWDTTLKFLVLCGGLGWIFHGTGFLFIRVK